MACGDRSGNLIQLVQSMEGLDWHEAVRFIGENSSQIDYDSFRQHISELLYEQVEPIRLRSNKMLRRETVRLLRRCDWNHKLWKSQRGFTKRTQEHWGLVCSNLSDARPMVIPVSVDGRITYHVRRAIRDFKPKYMYQRGMPRAKFLYGMDRSEGGTFVLVEGPLDAVAVWQALDEAGIADQYTPVAVMGDYVSDVHARLVEENADDVVLFFDNDRGGRVSTNSAIRRIRRVVTRVVDYGRNKSKDPGEMIGEEIVYMIENSKLSLGEVEVG